DVGASARNVRPTTEEGPSARSGGVRRDRSGWRGPGWSDRWNRAAGQGNRPKPRPVGGSVWRACELWPGWTDLARHGPLRGRGWRYAPRPGPCGVAAEAYGG